MANDPVSGAVIRDEFAHWDDIEVHIHGRDDPLVRPRLHRHRPQAAAGHPAGAGAASSASSLHFEHEASADLADWAGYDLVIAADGANSRIRDRLRRRISESTSRSAGTSSSGSARARSFEAFTFAFEETEAGWVWAHAYRFDDGLSTFIVEMAPDDLGRARPRPDGPGRGDRAVRADLRQISGRPRR